MAIYGGKRYDFRPPTHTLALKETWPLRWVVEDENGAPWTSFAGKTWGFALLDRLETANGWTDVQAAALIVKTGGQITASAPNLDVPVTPADQAALTARSYAYEVWETAGERRVAYGTIQVVA